jgi:hypothetical protein
VTKRLSVFVLVVLILVAAGCGPSPKTRAREFMNYLPLETGDWEQLEDDTVELLSSTVASKGHITQQYE